MARRTTYIDTGYSYSWYAATYAYDVFGRLDNTYIQYDDGTGKYIDYDESGSFDFNYAVYNADIYGQLDSSSIIYDDGRAQYTEYDQNNWYAYSSVTNNYAPGFSSVDYQRVVWDDGSTRFTDWDLADQFNFSAKTSNFTKNNKLESVVVDYDNGDRYTAWYDVANKKDYAKLERLFSEADGSTTVTKTMDDGSVVTEVLLMV